MSSQHREPAPAGFRPILLLGDPSNDSPRIFVELWDTQDWPEVRSHLALLPHIAELQFAHGEEHIAFIFRGHRFRFYRGSGEYTGVVEDPACSDDVLFAVADHLNRLLCPITTRGA